MKPKDQCLEVWGELACFTRPEMKVERFSYPVITPSAARGIFDAIYCKPKEFRWQITAIEVLPWHLEAVDGPAADEVSRGRTQPPRWPPGYIALRRNEVKEKGPSEKQVRQWIRGTKPVTPIIADGDSDLLGTDQRGRTQRQTMALKKVHYRLHAEVRPWPGQEHRLQAIENQFRRRAARGQCFFQPYLGCREFPAYFRLVEPGETEPRPVEITSSLGLMLYDVFDLSRPGDSNSEPFITLFHATMEQGVIRVPAFEAEEVLRPPGGEHDA